MMHNVLMRCICFDLCISSALFLRCSWSVLSDLHLLTFVPHLVFGRIFPFPSRTLVYLSPPLPILVSPLLTLLLCLVCILKYAFPFHSVDSQKGSDVLIQVFPCRIVNSLECRYILSYRDVCLVLYVQSAVGIRHRSGT